MDQAALDAKLNFVKRVDLRNASIEFYAVKVSTSNKQRRFQSVKRISCHPELQRRLKVNVSNCIEAKEHISELRDINTNEDNRFFHVESAATDFQKVIDIIEDGGVTDISAQTELNSFNGYVIQVVLPDDLGSFYAFRYLKKEWDVKNSAGRFIIFDNDLVASFSEDPRFTVSPYVDFIQYGEDVFIASIGLFEAAMNYRERLVEKRDEAITVIGLSGSFSDEHEKILKSVVGSDKHLMRQLASVYNKPYYNNPEWLTKLKDAAEEAGNWRIEFEEDGKIKVKEEKDYVKELLVLLQNKRVKTVVDGVMFDVDGELISLH